MIFSFQTGSNSARENNGIILRSGAMRLKNQIFSSAILMKRFAYAYALQK